MLIQDAEIAVSKLNAPHADAGEFLAGMASMGDTPDELAIYATNALERNGYAVDVDDEALVDEIEARIEQFKNDNDID